MSGRKAASGKGDPGDVTIGDESSHAEQKTKAHTNPLSIARSLIASVVPSEIRENAAIRRAASDVLRSQ
jgi:hypothetical protein